MSCVLHKATTRETTQFDSFRSWSMNAIESINEEALRDSKEKSKDERQAEAGKVEGGRLVSFCVECEARVEPRLRRTISI